jgi:hypothetical protein
MEAVGVDNKAVKWGMDNKILSFIGFNAFLHNWTDTRGFACCRNTVVLSVEVEFYILDTTLSVCTNKQETDTAPLRGGLKM